jgi:hypothetical protein
MASTPSLNASILVLLIGYSFTGMNIARIFHYYFFGDKIEKRQGLMTLEKSL